MDTKQNLEESFLNFLNELKEVTTQPEVLNLKSSYIGKKGIFTQVLKTLKDASVEVKREVGQKCNHYKMQIERNITNKLLDIEGKEMRSSLEEHWIDITMRDSILDKGLLKGGYHPITQVLREIEDIFLSMGFEVLDGPFIEDDFHNFEALNVAADHPARDMQDTFWFEDKKHLLRTQTSTIQIRGMEKRRPPFKFIGPGKSFRSERTDASHEMVFHQVEGMMVGHDLSVGNLLYFSKELLKGIFKKDVDIRIRPGFFPFVEPGFEIDIKCLICGGKGCSVCKKVGWLELLPCGMVHPNVLLAGKIDPQEWNGFAFGLGLDRLVMMRYGIDDIRHFNSGDLRFQEQFASF